jgi:hypothetical protein
MKWKLEAQEKTFVVCKQNDGVSAATNNCGTTDAVFSMTSFQSLNEKNGREISVCRECDLVAAGWRWLVATQRFRPTGVSTNKVFGEEWRLLGCYSVWLLKEPTFPRTLAPP